MDAKPTSFLSALFHETSQMNLRFPLAILTGIITAGLGSLGWLCVSFVSSYQIGAMAVVVGVLVGRSMRFVAGEGSQALAYSSALLSFAGCLAGNLLTACYFVAKSHDLPFMDLFVTLDAGYASYLLIQSFDIMDTLFYGFAILQGHKLCTEKG